MILRICELRILSGQQVVDLLRFVIVASSLLRLRIRCLVNRVVADSIESIGLGIGGDVADASIAAKNNALLGELVHWLGVNTFEQETPRDHHGPIRLAKAIIGGRVRAGAIARIHATACGISLTGKLDLYLTVGWRAVACGEHGLRSDQGRRASKRSAFCVECCVQRSRPLCRVGDHATAQLGLPRIGALMQIQD